MKITKFQNKSEASTTEKDSAATVVNTVVETAETIFKKYRLDNKPEDAKQGPNYKDERSFSSSSSMSSESSISNEEKIKETIRRYAESTDLAISNLDNNDKEKKTDSSKQANVKDFNDPFYSRLSIDLTNDPDILKFMSK